MVDKSHEFRVSAKESEYLKQLASRDESLAGLLRFQEGAAWSCDDPTKSSRSQTTKGTLNGADGHSGFDENYSPNEEGQMLEELIDRFFLR